MLNNTINYDELDAEFGITPTIENKSVNNIALSNVQTLEPEYEQDYNDAYSTPSWFDDLNVCSEDEIKQWQAMGPMGIAEAWERNNKWQSFVPYINTTKDAAEAVNASVLLKRLKDGKELNEKQMDLLVDYLRDVKEQQVRGYSFAGGVVNGTLESIPYLEEFAIGLATSEAGVGLASLAKTITTIGAKKVAKKAVQQAMQEASVQSTMTGVKKNLTKQQIKSIYDDAILKTTTSKAIGEVGAKTFAKETLKATPQALLSSAKIGLTKMPQNFVGNIADRQIAGGIYVTDAGQGVFTNSENIALSFMKALGDTTFEALSETAGFMFSPINKFFAKPIRNVLPKKFYTEFDKLVSSRYGIKTTEALKKYGYDGILEEMGEEQLNRFLTNVFGSNGVQGYTLDGFLNNVFYFDREGKKGLEGFKTGALNAAESYASEALSFAAISGGARGAIGGTSKLAEKWNEKRLQNEYKRLANYSLNEFYLDQGLIKIKGSQSSTESALRHRANAMGIDSAIIDEYCKLSSENEMRAKLQELILDDNAKIDVEALRKEQEAVEKLRENYFNQLKAAGADDVVANQTASLYALGFAKLAKDSGKSINEIAETNISFKNLTEDEAVKQYNQGFNQVPQDVEPKFQAAASAGANENEIAEAEKEYAEKGTESKYFKRWFGDSKVVDENGKPLVVYHGSINIFEIFKHIEKFNSDIGALNTTNAFFFTDNSQVADVFAEVQKGNQTIRLMAERNVGRGYNNPAEKRKIDEEIKNLSEVKYQVYLSLKNPYIVDFKGKEYKTKEVDEIFETALENNHDGVIIKNILDNGVISNQYAVFNPEQIKSVDNRGTFDANNPNIFYQQDMYSAGNDIIEKSRNALSKLLEKFSNKPEANITVGDVFKQIPMFEPIKDFFNGIEDVKIVLEKNRETVNGHYNYKTDTLYLNEESLHAKNIPTSRIRTLLHELTHAHQKRFVDMYALELTEYAKGNINLNKYEVDFRLNYIKDFENAITANTNFQNYKKENRNLLNKAYKLEKKGTLNEPKNKKYYEVYNKIKDLYNEYRNTPNEFEADQNSDYLLNVLGLWGKYESERNRTNNEQYKQYVRNARRQNEYRGQYPERFYESWLYFRRSRSKAIGNANEINKSNNILFQSAWHGGAKNFDRFDLSFALSGEGAMAHGYGVYTAKNKDVSEKYRKRLSQSLKNAKYDGVPLYKTEFNKLNSAISEKLYLKGKEEALKKLNELKEQSEKNKDKEGFLGRSSRKFLEEYNEQLELLNSVDESKITDVNKGQLYEVDIPEDDVLLDEDLTINEQPEKVKEALKMLCREEGFNYLKGFDNEMKPQTGKQIYDNLRNYIQWQAEENGNEISDDNSAKEASLLLNKYGIKGITYDGKQDGRCYVIFDDKAVDIIKKYYQGLDEDSNEANTEESIRNAKGFFYEKKAFDGTPKENIVVLIKNKADASTLIHEFAHIYLQTLNNLARTSDKAKQQLLTVNKWLRYDGKEYTTAQHEKFADGFVAYVKSGKAPSYGLKRVFENFRRWLSDIYNNIVTNENVELDNETKKVFDELLGDLSVNQQEKLSEEIITKARDNAALRMRDELVEKGNVKFNELTDKQRRYRDTAYDIIFYALKHSKNEETRNYVQNISDLRMKLGSGNTKSLQRQFERIELLLAETDDAFSAHDGFLPEWGEFFNDTGVSYDNLQQGADAELALNAFEVIRDKKYLYDESFEELSENDIKKAQYELEYIINEYKYAEDKSVPMSAFFTWIDSQHPYIQDELLKQWENETNEIDRYQALSKFEQAKEDLKLKAAQMQGLGDYSMQFAEYARAIIKRLDFMTEKDKARIFDKLRDFNSFKEVQANLDDVMDFAQTLYNVTERRKIADDILREVKATIHEWKDGIKRTKYTYPANKLFVRLRELNNLPLEDIKDLYDAQVNEEIKPTYEADAVNTDDYYETIEKMFIEFKANGVYYNSTAFLQDLLTRVQNAKFTAKIARDEMDFERRMQAINLVDEAAKAVSKHKGKASKFERVYRYGFNLNNALEMMFDKNIKSKFTLDYLYAQKDAKVGADRDAVLNKLKENFGFKGVIADTLLFNKFIDMTKKGEFKITQRYSPDIAQGVIRETHRDKETGKQFTDKKINYAKDAARSEWQPEIIELSRMEVLYYYIQSLNEESYKILTDMGSDTQAPKGQFDKYEFDEMINQLTEQEKMMGLILQQAAEKYYDELNRYHIKKYHTELGKVKNYFPRKTELTEVKPLELFSDYANYSGVLSAQKQRTANAGARIAPANALAVLFQHMEKANTLIVMGEQLDLMNRVFKDQSLKKKVEIVWGIDTAKEFYNQIAGNLYSGQASMLSAAEDLLGKASNNVVKAQIFAKAQVGLKQIISFLNYGTGDEYVSTAEWNAAFWKQSFTPKEWKNNIDYMMNIPYLKDRFGRGGSTDALKRQLEQRIFAKMSLLDDFFSLPIKIGDMGAIILGGKPYIDALITKGYTEEQAQKIFIEKTVNEMQSSIPSTLSNIQRNAAKQPMAKMFFAYQNTPWQYFRVAAMSMIRFKQNPNIQTGLNMAKLTGLYMFVFPLIFNLASSLSLVTGDEDELQKDIEKSVIGGVTFVPLAGMFINAMLSGFLGERVSTGNWFDTAASKTGNIARKMAKGDDITAVDLLKALALFGEVFTGLPLTTLGTEVAGVYDVATGAPAKGILKVAGYSDYRAKKISGEED